MALALAATATAATSWRILAGPTRFEQFWAFESALQTWAGRLLQPLPPELRVRIGALADADYGNPQQLFAALQTQVNTAEAADWLEALDRHRNAAFATGDIVYVDGWPFARPEVLAMQQVAAGSSNAY